MDVKQVTQKLRKGIVEVNDVPIPSLLDNFVLVQNSTSVISAGTEKTKIDNFNFKPDLIKIDTEGSEYNSLISAKNTISKNNPIIIEIANGGWQVRVLIISLAAIAAPIVEETIFRGVLYRQLRTSSKAFNHAISILGSVLIVSFLFAAIHPQGWIAIPALMGIAIGMNLMREWRGTVIPSMVVHGVSNGLVTSMVLVFLSN
mgnify:CR=1 FL=1